MAMAGGVCPWGEAEATTPIVASRSSRRFKAISY
jgi:hypothetical protein